MSKVDLRVDWCSHEAAKYAVEHWHYSRKLPHSKTVRFGVWESDKFIGAVVFGDGANNQMFKPYGLTYEQGCELVRVALAKHASPVSRIVAIALRMFKKEYPSIRLCLSFADPEQGHVGAIYQAGGWLYLGETLPSDEYIVNGKRMHGKALRQTRSTHAMRNVQANNVMEWARKVIDPNIKAVMGSAKHRYAMPLDDAMRVQIAPLAKPYPKRETSCVVSNDSVATGDQPVEGGANPTTTL